MKYKACKFALLVCLLLFSLFNCAKKDTVAGNVSEAGNACTGRIIYQDSTPAVAVSVKLFPVDYIPSSSSAAIPVKYSKTTDADGYYDLNKLDAGLYNVFAVKETLGVFIDSVVIPEDTCECDIPYGILKRLGLITGVSYMVGQDDTNQTKVDLYILGTDIITNPQTGGNFEINKIPEGNYELNVVPALNGYRNLTVGASITAGDTLDVDTIKIVMTGGPCFYDAIPGHATITSITGDSSNPSNLFEVKYDYTPDDSKAKQTYRYPKWPVSDLNYTINGYSPSLAYIVQNGIEVGNVYVCIRHEKVEGSCTPVVYTFLEEDFGETP